MKISKKNHGHTVLAQTADAYISQCGCCDEIQMRYKNIMLVFTWSDLVLFLKRLNSLPPDKPCYVIEIIDMRAVPSIKIGFASSGIFLNSNELSDLKQLLTKSCHRIDLASIFRDTITNN